MSKQNPYMKRYFATRRRLKVGLFAAGVCGGALIGMVLTVFGKVVTGAPPATMSNFLVNAGWFSLFGAIIGPAVTWSALRNVPLWRTVMEPLAAGVAGAAIGVAVGSPTLFLALVPVGIGASVARLSYSYRTQRDTGRLTDGQVV